MRCIPRAYGTAAAAVVAAAIIALIGVQDAKAQYRTEVIGGELEMTGFLDSEARYTVSKGPDFLNSWVNRFQLEAALTYYELGGLDELAFVGILRPEFDLAYYYGDRLGRGHVGRNATNTSYLGREFNAANDPIGFNGFGAALATGGLSKNVTQGVWSPDVLDNFEVVGGETFPLLSPFGENFNLECDRCRDIGEEDAWEIAAGKTDSSGAQWPLREAYVDAVAGNFWFRVGKQQVVWGKTDFFRMQDIINPVDFGQHFFFDSFEDIRIPQWIASAQWRPGSFGPFTDVALQLVWNFDEFRSVGLGNHSHGWAHPFGKEKALFAAFNTYFSPEPCAPNQGIPCTGNQIPSGFGIPVGVYKESRPHWKFQNTEIGGRFEFRVGPVRLALTNYWGWSDTPVFKFDTVNVSSAVVGGAQNDALIVDLPSATEIPVLVTSPSNAIELAAANGDAGAQAAAASSNASIFYRQGSTFGGAVSVIYEKVNTTGLAVDYFEPRSGIVFRVESSYTWDEPVQNQRRPDWLDHSDVMRFSIGMDRPTFIKFLNPNRTFFLSTQIFNTTYLDHEGDGDEGFVTPRDNWILTLFAQTHYLRDQVIPQAFFVWEAQTGSFVSGASVEWLITNRWSAEVGTNVIWGGRMRQNHDVGPFTSFTLDGDFSQKQSVLGYASEGIGALRDNDEVFVRLRYQF